MTFLIACLVGIATALSMLTVWFWIHTDPRRQRDSQQSPSPLLGGRARSEATGPDAEPAAPTDGRGQQAPHQVRAAAVPEAGGDDSSDEDFVAGPVMARQTWDFVAAARRAEDDLGPVEGSPLPATPRIAVPDRSEPAPSRRGDADELALARRRREREAARGLSDEVWDSVRRSVFDKLDR